MKKHANMSKLLSCSYPPMPAGKNANVSKNIILHTKTCGEAVKRKGYNAKHDS
jgi:hypothetical protein